MEKKTIGGFIAALRRAIGMKQKDLAERLNVSDKTVSRWERDDGAPDLSLIPVIAEIFGVTCDELLRGERRPPDQRSKATEKADAAPKAEKQRRRLLKSTMTQYKNRTYIAMGVSIVGLMAALLCNFEFYRGVALHQKSQIKKSRLNGIRRDLSMPLREITACAGARTGACSPRSQPGTR